MLQSLKATSWDTIDWIKLCYEFDSLKWRSWHKELNKAASVGEFMKSLSAICKGINPDSVLYQFAIDNTNVTGDSVCLRFMYLADNYPNPVEIDFTIWGKSSNAMKHDLNNKDVFRMLFGEKPNILFG